jgi:hypothetical protein
MLELHVGGDLTCRWGGLPEARRLSGGTNLGRKEMSPIVGYYAIRRRQYGWLGTGKRCCSAVPRHRSALVVPKGRAAGDDASPPALAARVTRSWMGTKVACSAGNETLGGGERTRGKWVPMPIRSTTPPGGGNADGPARPDGSATNRTNPAALSRRIAPLPSCHRAGATDNCAIRLTLAA